MRKSRRTGWRVGAMAVLMLVCVAWFSSTMLGLQISEGEELRAEAAEEVSYTTRTMTTQGTRGAIYDRRGVPLVESELTYAVELQYTNWDRSRADETLRRTLQILRDHGITYTSTIPIEGMPLAYGKVRDEAFYAFLEKRGWDPLISATALMEKLCERYAIPDDFTTEDTLAVVGLRYDLEVLGFSPLTPVVLAEEIDRSVASELALYDLPGVEIVTKESRAYRTTYLAHVLGRTGRIMAADAEKYAALGYAPDATVGLTGIELAYESLLRGKTGSVMRTYDNDGRLVGEVTEAEPEAGADVYLTIDMRIQQRLEDSLEQRILELRQTESGAEAEGGAAVAIRVGTSEVLAIGSYPTFDLSKYMQTWRELEAAETAPLYNRATQGRYAPGSTFKMVTAAAALQENVVEPWTIIRDEGVYSFYAPNYLYRCWIYNDYGRTHGDQNVVEALQNSCNYYFYETGRLLGIDRLDQYARLLGLGEKTGLEISEFSGILAGPDARSGGRWYPGDTLLAAIGQSDHAFTPVQLANYVATLCAGGVRYRARLVGDVLASSGEWLESNTPEIMASIDFEPENLDAILEGMLRVTEDGTASRVFQDYPVSVIGKTGSAQVETGHANGVFVLAAPAEKPEIAIAVVVEHGGSGNNVAFIARDILDAYFATKEE